MGTRANVHFYDKNNSRLVTIYHQYDGYVASGVGEFLIQFLNQRRLINGFSTEKRAPLSEVDVANGMGCLAAQYIALTKEEIGGTYIVPETTMEEYDYVVSVHKAGFEYVLTIRKHGEIDEIDMNRLQQYDNYDEEEDVDDYY